MITADSTSATPAHPDTAAAALIRRARAALAAHENTNAVTTPLLDRAERIAGEQHDAGGPLAGYTLIVKDNIDIADVITGQGARLLGALPALRTAPVVAALEAAGAITVAKANLHQFAYGASGQNAASGDIQNPRYPGYTPGGSSGGTAAAIAAGIARVGLGTDTAGSIRMPAACCGVVGLRPRNGVLSPDGVLPLSPSFDTVGPMGATVADTATLWDALLAGAARATAAAPLPGAEIAGSVSLWSPTEPEPHVLRPALERPAAPAGTSPGPARLDGVSLGVIDDADTAPFTRLGARVTAFDVDLAGIERSLWPSFRAEAGRSLAPIFPAREAEIDPGTAERIRGAQRETPESYRRSLEELRRWRSRVLASLDAAGLDALLCRTLGGPLPLAATGERAYQDRIGEMVAPFSGLNLAALAIGNLQIIARTEADALAIGRAYEDAGNPIPAPPLAPQSASVSSAT